MSSEPPPGATDAGDGRGSRRSSRGRPQTAFLVVVVLSVALVVALFVLVLLPADGPVHTGRPTTDRKLPPAAPATTPHAGRSSRDRKPAARSADTTDLAASFRASRQLPPPRTPR